MYIVYTYVSSYIFNLQEGITDPPSVASISRLLRGSEKRGDDERRKDYTIHGILGGKLFFYFKLSI